MIYTRLYLKQIDHKDDVVVDKLAGRFSSLLNLPVVLGNIVS